MKNKIFLITIFSCLLATLLNIQPAFAVEETFYPSDDSYVNSAYPDAPRGSVTSLIIGRIPEGAIRWPILHFDLSSIPLSATIDSAILSLVLYDSSGLFNVPIDAYLLDENWDEGSATWNEDLEIYGDSVGRLDVGHGMGNRYWELSPALIESRWIETPSDNHGLILKGDYDGLESFARSFRSKEYADSGVHPKLYVTYTPADEAAPDLSEIMAKEITQTSANITWKSDEDATSEVGFWKTEGFVTSAGDDEMKTDHQVALSDLRPGTTYTFQVTSKDADGNEATSAEHEFTTLAMSPTADEAGDDTVETTDEPESIVISPETTGEGAGEKEVTETKVDSKTKEDEKEATKAGEGTTKITTLGLGLLVVILIFVILFLLKQDKKKPPPKKEKDK